MIAEVLVCLEIKKSFDYKFKDNLFLKEGMRVLVDFAGKERVGFVVRIKKSSSQRKLKSVLEVLDNFPAFTPNLLKFSQKISKYYLYSQGEILEMMLPLYLRRKKILRIQPQNFSSQISRREEVIYLRENITKTDRFNYYKEIIEANLRNNKKVIICVPQKEEAFFIKDFLEENIKALSVALLFGSERASSQFKEWLKLREGKAQVCIGTRFAIFSPLQNLGAIVVEKENFFGYFQPEKPFYHLRDLALMRAKIDKVVLVFHSDFPSLELYSLLKRKKITYINMFKEIDSKVKIFNLEDYKLGREALFSGLSLEIIRSYLDKKKRVIIFWNRKGFANLLRCNLCKEIIKCPRCGNFLSFSLDKHYFCRRCGYKNKEGDFHRCGRDYIKKIGIGIERLQLKFKRFFPDKKILKLTKEEILPKNWDILISTQKILFLKSPVCAQLVVFSGIDSLLSWGDFNSSLEVYHLLERLKEMAREELIIFTFHPSYYLFQALKKGWEWFYKREFKERKAWELPPYSHLAKISLRAKREKTLLKRIETLKALIEKQSLKVASKIEVYGPLKEKASSKKLSYSLVVKAPTYNIINKILKKVLEKFKKSTTKLSLIIN